FIAAPERYVDANGNRLTGSHAHAGAHEPAATRPPPGAAERAPSGVPKEVPAGTIYTCPMHPEIRQVGPGSCPICGMALEPRLPTAAEDDSEVRAVRRRFWISAALTFPLALIAMVPHVLDLHLPLATARIFRALEIALSLPVVAWAGLSYYRR